MGESKDLTHNVGFIDCQKGQKELQLSSQPQSIDIIERPHHQSPQDSAPGASENTTFGVDFKIANISRSDLVLERLSSFLKEQIILLGDGRCAPDRHDH
jgi:hypothetical protein